MGMAGGSSNNLRQVAFIGLVDDGLQGSATPIAAKNVDWIQEAVGVGLTGTKFRVRFLVEHTIGPGQGDQFAFMFAIDNGFEQRLSTTSTGLRIVASDYLVNGEDPVDYVGRLGTGVWAWELFGGVMTADPNYTGGVAWHGEVTETEVEICVELVADELALGQIIEIYPVEYIPTRIFPPGVGPQLQDFYDGYTAYPFLTVAMTPTVPAYSWCLCSSSLVATTDSVKGAAAVLAAEASMVADGDTLDPQPGVPAVAGVSATPIVAEAGGIAVRI
jgi:hypothetical protein